MKRAQYFTSFALLIDHFFSDRTWANIPGNADQNSYKILTSVDLYSPSMCTHVIVRRQDESFVGSLLLNRLRATVVLRPRCCLSYRILQP